MKSTTVGGSVLASGLLAAALSLAPALPASGTAAGLAYVGNGDFETTGSPATTVPGWTTLDSFVDLGTTSIAGCPTVDTSSYTSLRGIDVNASPRFRFPVPVDAHDALLMPDGTDLWLDETGSIVAPGTPYSGHAYYGHVSSDRWGDSWTDFYVLDLDGKAVRISQVHLVTGNSAFADALVANLLPLYLEVPDPTVRQDFTGPADDRTFWDSTAFDVRTVDPGTANDVLAPNGTSVLQLSSSLSGAGYWGEGYVAHGPAVYSAPFTTAGPRTVSLDWLASGAAEDYHVLAYVVDTATCAQTELLDSTGRSSAWSTASVVLPDPGTYRVVVVAGSYDADWNGEAGVYLDVDDVRVTPTGAGITVEPLFAAGDDSAAAGVQLSGAGLEPGSAWTAELHSTPVVLASGVTGADGTFWHLSALPAGVAAGRHRITLTGTAADGSPVTDTVYLTVSAAGSIAYVSTDGPEGDPTGGPDGTPSTAAVADARHSLASTGFAAAPSLAGGLLLTVLGGGALLLLRRSGRRTDA